MMSLMLDEQPKTNRELLEIVDTYVSSVHTLYQKTQGNTLHAEIDMLLKEKKDGWMRQIKELMSDEKCLAAGETDEGLQWLKNIFILSGGELEEDFLLEKVSSVDEWKEIYQKTIFYLLRMELDMPEEDCIGFLELMEYWEFSATYLIMVLTLARGVICDGIKTGIRLVNLLYQNGYQDDAEEIAVWMKAKIDENAGRQA